MANIDIQKIMEIAAEAGHIILTHYKSNSLKINTKSDSSPVTVADIKSNEYITASLQKLYPQIPIVSEEGDFSEVKNQINEWFWLVDPLDGTKGFINQNDEFTVNIALVHNTKPVLGVIYLPVNEVYYYASEDLGAAYRKDKNSKPIKIECSNNLTTDLKLAVNRSFKIPEIEKKHQYKFSITQMNAAGKFGLLSEGNVDLYFRNSPTYEWDTAAGHCIVNMSGGTLTDLEGNDFIYGKSGFLNPAFIAIGKTIFDKKEVTEILKTGQTLR